MKLQSGYIFLITVVAAICAGTAVATPEDIVAELKSCARMSESNARTSCYEALGKRVIEDKSSPATTAETVPSPAESPEPAAGVAATATASSAVAPAPASQPQMEDNMGGYKYAEKASDHPDNDIHTRVVQCQQDRDKVWFFKFENGQVWKQVDRSRLNFKDCDFPVVVSKDGFGYKLQVEGEGRKIRISRRK